MLVRQLAPDPMAEANDGTKFRLPVNLFQRRITFGHERRGFPDWLELAHIADPENLASNAKNVGSQLVVDGGSLFDDDEIMFIDVAFGLMLPYASVPVVGRIV